MILVYTIQVCLSNPDIFYQIILVFLLNNNLFSYGYMISNILLKINNSIWEQLYFVIER